MSPVTSPGVRTSSSSTDTEPDLTAQRRADELARVRFRRALVLVFMTLLLPGSAQLVAGNKRVGRIALRVWLGCAVTVLLLVVVGALWNGLLFRLGASPLFLGLLRFSLVAVAVGWALLFIDAWRLGQPLGLRQKQRLTMVGVNGFLCFAVAGSLLFVSHLVHVQRDFVVTVFGDGASSSAEDGRYNVLLVGGDAGEGRFGLRTDSLTVASVDAETGKTVLFGLPRNLTGFPFPEGSVLDQEFPRGYDCEECTLNSVATWAADHPDLFADSETPGMDATIMAVEGITGLKVNYYALVSMSGFRSLVRAMGGLTLNVRDPIPIGGGEQGQIGTIEPGVRKLSGYEVLWFTRSRMSADDYSRMARQKCVMNAMLQQISPQDVVARFGEFAAAGSELLETDLPASELGRFAELALKARSQKMASVSFVPPAINTSDPDMDKIHTMIEDAIAKAEATGEEKSTTAKKPSKGFSKNRGGPSTGGSVGSLSTGYAANQAQDLSKVC